MAEKEGKCPSNPLEQYVLLAKSVHGAAAVALVKQVLEAPGVYTFGELLAMPNIQELANGEYEAHWRLLNLFAFGTCTDYKENSNSLPPLSAPEEAKLRHLTIVSLATKTKHIPYSVLLEELGITNLRQLEDLIIEAIYADIIRGKLDQKNQKLEVEYAIGRDIKPETVDQLVRVLEDWCSSCENVLNGIGKQITKANSIKEKKQKQSTQLEQEVENLKKAIKASTSDSVEGGFSGVSQFTQATKSPPGPAIKQKGLRGSAKMFSAQRR